MLEILTIATVLGLSAGFAPGPLLTLIISETLRHGMRAGILVALAPLLTGAPIGLVVLLLFSQFSHVASLIGVIGVGGGAFVVYLGLKSLRLKPVELELTAVKKNSLMIGVVTNLLSPMPYLFWLGVGAPLLLRAYEDNPLFAVMFFVIFYGLIVSSKLLLVYITARSRRFLSGILYLNTMRLLGIIMCVLGVKLIIDGLQLAGLIGMALT